MTDINRLKELAGVKVGVNRQKPMTLTENQVNVEHLMNATIDAWSRDRYGEQAWKRSILELAKLGYTEKQIEWILMSKNMRWAADEFATHKDGVDICDGTEIVKFRNKWGAQKFEREMPLKEDFSEDDFVDDGEEDFSDDSDDSYDEYPEESDPHYQEEPICPHGFVGACAECDGSGQMADDRHNHVENEEGSSKNELIRFPGDPEPAPADVEDEEVRKAKEAARQAEENKPSPHVFRAIDHVVSYLDHQAEKAKDRSEKSMLYKDAHNLEEIKKDLKDGAFKKAASRFRNMDTAARDYLATPELVPSGKVRKELAKFLGYELIHEGVEGEKKYRVYMEYVKRQDQKHVTRTFVAKSEKEALTKGNEWLDNIIRANKDVTKKGAKVTKAELVESVNSSGIVGGMTRQPPVSVITEDKKVKNKTFQQMMKGEKAAKVGDVDTDPAATVTSTGVKNQPQEKSTDSPEKVGDIDTGTVAKNTSADVEKAKVKDTTNADIKDASMDKPEKVEDLPTQAGLENEPVAADEFTSKDKRDDEENKVKVPEEVTKALKDKVEELRKNAELQVMKNKDLSEWYSATADIFDDMLKSLNDGYTRTLALKVNKYATPTVQELPPVVWKFLVNGGKVRSLADHFREIKDKKK